MVDYRRIGQWAAFLASVFAAIMLVSPVVAKTQANKSTPSAKQAPTPSDDGRSKASNADVAADAPKPPSDGKKYDLRYKLNTGDVLRYTVTHHAAIRSTIDESTQAAETKTDSVKVWKVTDVLPNHQIEFMDVIEQVHMVNQLPDRAATEYDSAKDKTPPPGYEDTAKAIGVPLSVVRMTPRGEVVTHKIKYQQGPAEPDAMVAVRLPDGPVAIGATWDEPFEINVQLQSGSAKSIQTRRHYKLAGVSGSVASIEVSYQILSPIDSEVESKLVQRLMKGTVRFDMAKGRILGQEYEIDKRVLGFAGATSSMHYVMQMKEELADSPPKGSNQQKPTPRSASRATNSKGTITR
ncbi:MAG TPA: hypothetical protein VGM76_03385 [Lacipirellulaceae bacterium]|jgi:hypothetical protein